MLATQGGRALQAVVLQHLERAVGQLGPGVQRLVGPEVLALLEPGRLVERGVRTQALKLLFTAMTATEAPPPQARFPRSDTSCEYNAAGVQ